VTTTLEYLVQRCAIVHHDAYEEAAMAFGYETRAESRGSFASLPANNRRTMLYAEHAALTAAHVPELLALAAAAKLVRWHWEKCEQEGEGQCCFEANRAFIAAQDAVPGRLLPSDPLPTVEELDEIARSTAAEHKGDLIRDGDL
jgi:hypothetical protein